MSIFARHFRYGVLDPLPSVGQVPKTVDSTICIVSDKVQNSNIDALSVHPGLSRSDTIAPLLNAPHLHLLTQSTISAMHLVLHVLFFSTAFKSNACQGTDALEEVLKAAALYCECVIVNLRIPIPATADAQIGHGLGVYDEFATHGTKNLSSYGGRTTQNLQGNHRTRQAASVLQQHRFLPSAIRNTLSLNHLALTEFLDSLNTFQTLQARIQCLSRPPTPKLEPLILVLPTSLIAAHVSEHLTHTLSLLAWYYWEVSVMLEARCVLWGDLEEVDSVDVFYNSDMFEKAKTKQKAIEVRFLGEGNRAFLEGGEGGGARQGVVEWDFGHFGGFDTLGWPFAACGVWKE
ncbi:hypothetical protein DFJ58DRAFT_722621 [Suillus subalutaceus]|uniref:uncharacterized protein n=1 Tax=Suillus subalutaceus TaxID=48586 RepID=UPI001B86311A|nr:uncharacterized protein DFJ58DRAFT_722621 [Suillus subalutaceus]KAG1871872.1 hypothetical protein DFJ58DRAFT_722621 [Suillus subalutaceus]